MSKELYIGSLSYEATEYDIEKLFSVSGRVTSVHLICDNKTGEFKGCGYVRMSSEAEAKDAINSLDGAMLIDRRITVSEANPQKQKTQAGGYKGKLSGTPRVGGSTKEAASKPGLSKKATPKTAATKPGGFKPATAKPATAKPATAKPATAKPATAKPATAKPAAAKPAATKPSAAKLWFAKSGGPKTGKK